MLGKNSDPGSWPTMEYDDNRYTKEQGIGVIYQVLSLERCISTGQVGNLHIIFVTFLFNLGIN